MAKFLSTAISLTSLIVIGLFCRSFDVSEGQTRSGRPAKGDSQSEGQCFYTYTSGNTRRGTITSPDYPRGYRAGIKCTYHLLGRSKERIQLVFGEVELRQRGADDVDQLMVVTSVDKNSPKHPRPSTQHSPQHVDFLGDFPATRSPRRTLSSDQRIAKDVPSPAGQKKTSEESKLLDQDKYSVLGVYSGRAEPPLLMSAGKHVIITMVTKKTPPDVEEANAAGFKLDFSFVSNFGITSGEQDQSGDCIFRYNSGQLRSADGRQGTFQSPNHPGLYPRSTDCYFLFERATNETLVIGFKHLDIDGIPPLCSNESESDFLELRHEIRICTSHPEVRIPAGRRVYKFGPATKAVGHPEADRNYPDMTLTGGKDGEVITVRFHTNSIYDAQGFLAEYKFEKSIGPKVAGRGTVCMAAVGAFLTLVVFSRCPGRI